MTEQSTEASTRTIRVVILRHGERADEVFDGRSFSRRALSHKERIDPFLTETGHCQARSAFQKIFTTFSKRRIAVFSSPLRRTVGTAMMAAGQLESGVAFSIPRHCEEDSTTPILIMNGLSDPAAHIQHIGGAYKAVRNGFIDCAAMRANQENDKNSPIMSALPDIIRTAKRGVPSFLPHGEFLRFYKEDDVFGFVAMTKAISLQGDADADAAPKSDPKGFKPVRRDEDFLSAANRAVCLSLEGNCGVCVLVSHRESIRYMARKAGQGGKHRFHTPYCCTGVFDAIVSGEDGSVNWEFVGVVPYEELDERFSTTTTNQQQEQRDKNYANQQESLANIV